MKVLWCDSCQLVFEGSVPTCACFRPENFFVTCFCCFFNGKKERREKGGEAKGKRDAVKRGIQNNGIAG